MQRVRWASVALYYVYACAISWPFFWWRDVLDYEGFPAPRMLGNLILMWGPGIAALLCLWIFRRTHIRQITIRGTSILRSVIFLVTPLVVLIALSARDGPRAALDVAVLGVTGTFFITGEELGWRGFLQDALRPMRPAWRFLLIGVLWEAWHFTTRYHDRSLGQAVFVASTFMVFTILFAFLIGWAVERTRSLLVAIALHSIVDIVAERPGVDTLIAAGVAIAVWSWLLWSWAPRVPAAEAEFIVEAT